jgi:hypothetical protein
MMHSNLDRRRSEIERLIATKTIRALLAEGWVVSVFDGEETTVRHSSNDTEILDALGTTGEDMLIAHGGTFDGTVFTRKSYRGWIHLVWGNGQDVVTDYTETLEPVMAPVLAYADAWEDERFWAELS